MLTCDFLVIGSGIAGLNFALLASKHGKVVLVTKSKLFESNSKYAQGGIAGVISEEDSVESHIKDTVRTGCGAGNEKAIKILVQESYDQIQRLISLGVKFDKTETGLKLSREGGHSRSRVVFSKDCTGKAIISAFTREVRNSGIEVLENHKAVDLMVHNKRCFGCFVKHTELKCIFAKTTILATGGLGQVYSRTSNPKIATGDGLAMAYRAGAQIADIEFVQFHPTTLDLAKSPNFLISETVRGEGGILLNGKGERFMLKYHDMAELAPRDVVSRVIVKEAPVVLDIRHKGRDFIIKRFPTIYEQCKKHGLDITKHPIPVTPAAHFSCGGVKTDLEGRTSIKGLFAIGEVACTGVHGANRLASNSLLEGMVFSSQTLKPVLEFSRKQKLLIKNISLPAAGESKRLGLRLKCRETMWENVGISRSRKSLLKAIRVLRGIEPGNDLELRNMIDVGLLISTAALLRKETRGTHYRTDYPRCRKWNPNMILSKENLNKTLEQATQQPLPLSQKLKLQEQLSGQSSQVSSVV